MPDRRPLDRPKALAGLLAGAALLLATGMTQGAGTESVTKAHGISTFGDLQYPADFTHLAYVNPDAPKGGEFSMSWLGTFDSMNPYSRKGRSGLLASAGFEDMMVGVADEIGALYCLLCETVEYPDDRSWAIFNMRPEARFSDGSPLTAEDVKFTYEIFLNEGLVSFRAVLAQYVDSVEVLGAHRVKYNFKPDTPIRDRVQVVAGLPVMSAKWFADTGAVLDESRLQPGLGSGPYQLDRYDINARIVYRRNPDYWGRDLPINVGRANYDTIRVEYFGDSSAALEGFKAGAYTFRNENSSKNWATAYDFPAVADGTVTVAELPDGTIATGQSYIFNLRREKFQDPRVRQALGLMFNFEWSNETLFYGIYARIDSFWENSDLEPEGPPSPEEIAVLQPLVDEGLIDAALLSDVPIAAPGSGARQFDRANRDAATRLLNEAGWVTAPPPPRPAVLGLVPAVLLGGVVLAGLGFGAYRSSGRRGQIGFAVAGAAGFAVIFTTLGLPRPSEADGLLRKDGRTLDVEILSDSPTFDRVHNPYVSNLQALGVNARLNRVDPAQYTDLTRSHQFDMIVEQFPTGYEPGSSLQQYFGCKGVDDVFNSMGLCDPAVERLIADVMAAETREALHVAVKALDRVMRARNFWVPQWYSDKHRVAYFDFYAYPAELPPYALGELDFWWIDPEKEAALRAAGQL